MKHITSQELKDIMYKYNIPNIELSHYINYTSQYITMLRGGRFPMTYEFQAALMNFLIRYRSIDFITAAKLTGIMDGDDVA